MTFQKANKNVQMLTLKIDNINIEQVKEFNFLGLIIDANLNWKRLKTIQPHVLKRLEF